MGTLEESTESEAVANHTDKKSTEVEAESSMGTPNKSTGAESEATSGTVQLFKQGVLNAIAQNTSPIAGAVGGQQQQTPSSNGDATMDCDPSTGGTHGMTDDETFKLVYSVVDTKATVISNDASQNGEETRKGICSTLDNSSSDDDESAPEMVNIYNNPDNSPAKRGRPRRGLQAACNTRSDSNGGSNSNVGSSSNCSAFHSNSGTNGRAAKATYASSWTNNNNNMTQNRTNRGKNATQLRVPHANETLLAELIKQAEFELHQDPYRGMVLEGDDNAIASSHNPWKKCIANIQQFKGHIERNNDAILNIDNVNKNDFDGTDLATAWVEEVCGCHCPSSLEWTRLSVCKDRQAMKKKRSNKKRKVEASTDDTMKPPQVGHRPDDPNFRCQCDYNPYCVESLGGAVNSLFEEKTKSLFEKKKRQYDNLQEMMRAQQQSLSQGIVGDDDDNSTGTAPMVIDLESDVPSTTAKQKNDDKSSVQKKEADDDEVIEVSGSTSSISNNMNVEETNGIDYAPETAKQLKQIRRCILVKKQPILDHLEYLLFRASKKASTKMITDDLLQILTRWHSSLIFSNPLQHICKATNTYLPIALPPGISNLGATCYLNTQLQCLAQNKAFLKGIISWRPVDKQDPGKAAAGGENSHQKVMNSVLKELQSLLVQMIEGSQRTVTTLAFSTALGLEHDEQQDPNEFARLLFERMHESFQQHPALKKLLPSLFEGSTTYETQCLACKTISKRSESFMDLNLPIVQLPKEEDDDEKKKGAFGKITSYFKKFAFKGSDATKLPNSQVDTDLQYCLNLYSSQEKLDGDNQYFCGNCNCKQDAVRETSLGSLPPVLNIQLSRYVFDLKNFTKKKLTDKVLLPRKLQVDTKNSNASGDAHSSKTYVLCAVMKHQGNSAYRGHYVAEVQDFLTGQWFEFNDEKVTLLHNGPSCSYMPDFFNVNAADNNAVDKDGDVKMSSVDEEKETKISNRKAPKLAGSSDAYNMYYVEESYLANKTLESFEALEEQLGGLCKTSATQKDESNSESILQTIARERGSLYEQLTELCLVDGRSAERLDKRRKRLHSEMISSCARPVVSTSDHEKVWVAADLLRNFFSCKDRLEDLMRVPPGEPMLKHKQLLCRHSKPGLHPRIARRGKLLPRHWYDTYVSMMAAERCLFLNEDDQAHSLTPDAKTKALFKNLNDCLITPQSNLHCEECEASYKSELNSKLHKVKLLKSLFVDIDQKNESSFWDPWSLDDDDEDEDDYGDERDEYGFVVPKTFLTAFRKKIEADLLKELSRVNFISAKEEKTSSTAAVSIDVGEDEHISDAVEEVQLESSLEGLDALDLSKFRFENASESGGLDHKINSSITCSHGICPDPLNKTKVKWLKWKVWEPLKQLFPKAIEHRMRRTGTAANDGPTTCTFCEKDQESKNSLVIELVRWYDEALDSNDRDLKVFFRNPTEDATIQELFGASLTGDDAEANGSADLYFVVSRHDIALWRKMLKVVLKLKRGVGKSKPDGDSVRQTLESLLSEKKKDWTKPAMEGFFRIQKCKRHGLTAPIFEQTENSNVSYLSSSVQLLNKLDYENFALSIDDIFKVLVNASRIDKDVIDLSTESGQTTGKIFSPPEVRMINPGHKAQDDDDEIVLLGLPSNPPPVSLSVSPVLCQNQECCQEYQEAQEPANAPENSYGSAADAPIVIEEDDDDTPNIFQLKVVEAEAGASHDAVVKALIELEALPSMTATAPTITDGGLRRSSRKRKAHFPCGPILGPTTSVGIAMHHNLAAVRLLICQSLENFELDQKLTLIFAPGGCVTVGGDVPVEQPVEPRFRELSFDANDQVLSDVYASMTDDPKMERLGNPATSLLFLREANSDKNSSFPQEALMDALLEKANTIAKEDESKKGKKKPAERGFQGTLLSSIRSTPSGSPRDEQRDGPEKEENNPDELKVKDKKAGLEPTNKSPVKDAKVKAESETMTRNVNGRESRSQSADVQSVLEQLFDPKKLSTIVEHLKGMLGTQCDDKQAKQAAQWALEQKGLSTNEDQNAAAVNRYFTVCDG